MTKDDLYERLHELVEKNMEWFEDLNCWHLIVEDWLNPELDCRKHLKSSFVEHSSSLECLPNDYLEEKILVTTVDVNY